MSGVGNEILEELIGEDEDEHGTKEVEDEVERAVGDEDGFATEPGGDDMTDVLHELPEDTDAGDDADDVQPGIAATTTADGVDDPAEQCRGVRV